MKSTVEPANLPHLTKSRRAFLHNGTLVLAAASLGSPALQASCPSADPLTIGLVTDMHYADKPPAGTRYYRESLRKLAEATEVFRQQPLDFLVELGDFIDAADDVSVEQKYLERINREFSAICDQRHYVLGNHCVDTLTKPEFLDGVGQAKSYYAFDRGDFHFIVLDACFRGDGTPYGRKNFEWTDTHIPAEELEWLRDDLASTDKRAIVFAHQRLDVSDSHGVKNNAQVRQALEASGKVLAVFQGHSHRNDLKLIGGIHYCTLVAMVENSGPDNNGYSLLKIAADGTLQLTGFRQQQSYQWPAS